MGDSIAPKLALALVCLLEGSYWCWLFVRARHGDYPVTFLGWASLIVDPIIVIFFIAIALLSWKYRTRD
jgi:hypothetical protein